MEIKDGKIILKKYKKLYSELNRDLIDESIDNLFKEKENIFYTPKYQRNYVWDITKDIRLIETILINGEILPITVIKVNNQMEIIDGRQRIEIILNLIISLKYVSSD